MKGDEIGKGNELKTVFTTCLLRFVELQRSNEYQPRIICKKERYTLRGKASTILPETDARLAVQVVPLRMTRFYRKGSVESTFGQA